MNDNLPYKKLYRSRKNSIIAGICGGMGDYFAIDPTWIRLIFIIFFFVGGSAFLVYLLLWFLMPLEPDSN